MINDPPLLKIRRESFVINKKTLLSLQGIPLAYLVDAMEGRGALDHRIRLLEGYPADTMLIGPALTCHCGPGDNMALCAAISEAHPGDVIVAATDASESTCLTGDLLMGMADNCKISGLITDGLVRDSKAIKEIGLPVFSKGVSPNSPVRKGPGTVGFPVVLGGVSVASGDVIAAGTDGVIVIPREKLELVLSILPKIKATEKKTEQAVKDGMKIMDSVKKILKSDKVQYFDKSSS